MNDIDDDPIVLDDDPAPENSRTPNHDVTGTAAFAVIAASPIPERIDETT